MYKTIFCLLGTKPLRHKLIFSCLPCLTVDVNLTTTLLLYCFPELRYWHLLHVWEEGPCLVTFPCLRHLTPQAAYAGCWGGKKSFAFRKAAAITKYICLIWLSSLCKCPDTALDIFARSELKIVKLSLTLYFTLASIAMVIYNCTKTVNVPSRHPTPCCTLS